MEDQVDKKAKLNERFRDHPVTGHRGDCRCHECQGKPAMTSPSHATIMPSYVDPNRHPEVWQYILGL